MNLMIFCFNLRLRVLILLVLSLNGTYCISQTDSLSGATGSDFHRLFQQHVLRSDLIAPVGFITIGVVSIKNPYIKNQNVFIRDNLQTNHPGKFPIDDYSQYIPTASYFALDVLGVSGKHNIKTRLFTAGISHLIMAGAVNLLKGTIPTWRPDMSANNSFPSGHTATAFVGAELVWQEYSHQSIWYGIGAYGIAAGTGFFRMYNNKHWLSDVIMGAGIGILSTKISYWLLPALEERIQKKRHPYLLYPTYNGRQMMLSFNCKI